MSACRCGHSLPRTAAEWLAEIPRDPDAAEHLAALTDAIGDDPTAVEYRERGAAE